MTGAYKERGALNKILLLSPEEKKRGVICASAGNHAQAVAYHATRRGIRSTIVMPTTTPLVKVAATQNYGGERNPATAPITTKPASTPWRSAAERGHDVSARL